MRFVHSVIEVERYVIELESSLIQVEMGEIERIWKLELALYR